MKTMLKSRLPQTLLLPCAMAAALLAAPVHAADTVKVGLLSTLSGPGLVEESIAMARCRTLPIASKNKQRIFQKSHVLLVLTNETWLYRF